MQIPSSRVAACVLICLCLLSLLAPFLESVLQQNPNVQNLSTRLSPPSIQIASHTSWFHSEPATRSPHWLGTDELGRDVLIRLIYGGRVSLGIALLVTLVSGMIGLVIGTLAGYYGGLFDALLMRWTDAFLALPLLPILVVVAAIDFQKLTWLSSHFESHSFSSFLKMILLLCLFSWMSVARIIRGAVMSLKNRDFVLAARTLGATDGEILWRHILPQVRPVFLVAVSTGASESILWETGLSFLGLGIQPPTPSWGNMLMSSQEIFAQAPTLVLIPGLLIVITVLSINTLGEGIRKVFAVPSLPS